MSERYLKDSTNAKKHMRLSNVEMGNPHLWMHFLLVISHEITVDSYGLIPEATYPHYIPIYAHLQILYLLKKW